MKKICLIITTIVIALLSLGYKSYYNNDNFVFLKGIAHPSLKHYQKYLIFKGYPWSLHNATIMHRFVAAYNMIKILANLSYKKTLMHNARINSNAISFEENGFMLLKNQQIIDPVLNEVEYKQHIIGVLKELFPTAKTIQFVHSVRRGIGDNHAIGFVHIDQPTRQGMAYSNTFKEYSDLILDYNHTIRLIGIWRPIQMKSNVCKDSLALLDSATVEEDDIVIFHQDYNRVEYREGVKTVKNINNDIASVAYNENHKWYYYPHMTNDEMIIFNHFRSDKFQLNAHGSFTPNDCGSGHEARKSVGSRVLLQF